MRSECDIPTFQNKIRDHSSGLVCISRLTCMAGQGDFHPQKQKYKMQDKHQPTSTSATQKGLSNDSFLFFKQVTSLETFTRLRKIKDELNWKGTVLELLLHSHLTWKLEYSWQKTCSLQIKGRERKAISPLSTEDLIVLEGKVLL